MFSFIAVELESNDEVSNRFRILMLDTSYNFRIMVFGMFGLVVFLGTISTTAGLCSVKKIYIGLFILAFY